MFHFLLSFILASQAPDSAQPVLTWEPEKPAWGDTVTVTYHHDAPGAVFKGSLPLMASIEYNKPPKTLDRTGNVSTVKFVIPDSVPFVRLVVFSIEDWEPPRCGGTIIEIATPEGWVPPEESLEALRYRWLGFKFERITRERLIQEIDSLKKSPSSALAGYVAIYGYILLGEIDSAWAMLAMMREKYPQDPAYSRALMEFTYGVEDKTLSLVSARIDTLWKWMDERITSGETEFGFLSWAGTRWNEGNTSLSIKERERLLLKASKNDPLNYWYHFFLADHYLEAAHDTLKAEIEYSAVIDLILRGEPQKTGQEPYGGVAFSMYLPRAMLSRAKIRSATGRYEAALGDLSFLVYAKQDQEKEREALFEMGKVWQGLGRYRKAEDAYIKALKLGYPQAEPALRGIYSLLYGNQDYESWLTEKLELEPGEQLPLTQDFGFTDLEGKPGRWSELKGKIVVVNIWSLGCSPCLVEIPSLNKLVEEYQGKGVEFIGFTGDGIAPLEGYFKEHPFNYRILRPDSSDFAFALTASPYSKPWHIVVDQEGRVRFIKRGAFLKESEMQGMKLVIDQLLREKAAE